MNKKLIYFAFLFLLVFLLGFFLGTKSKTLEKGVSGGQANTFQAGWEAAKKRLSESGFPMMGNAEIKSASGQVTAVNGNKVTVKISPLEPLADPTLDTRVIEIGSGTKIYQLVPKTPEQVQKEMEEFNKKFQEGEGQALPPSTSDKNEVGLSEVKAGQYISVMADKDIKNLKQFEAAEIDIQAGQ